MVSVTWLNDDWNVTPTDYPSRIRSNCDTTTSRYTIGGTFYPNKKDLEKQRLERELTYAISTWYVERKERINNRPINKRIYNPKIRNRLK